MAQFQIWLCMLFYLSECLCMFRFGKCVYGVWTEWMASARRVQNWLQPNEYQPVKHLNTTIQSNITSLWSSRSSCNADRYDSIEAVLFRIPTWRRCFSDFIWDFTALISIVPSLKVFWHMSPQTRFLHQLIILYTSHDLRAKSHLHVPISSPVFLSRAGDRRNTLPTEIQRTVTRTSKSTKNWF